MLIELVLNSKLLEALVSEPGCLHAGFPLKCTSTKEVEVSDMCIWSTHAALPHLPIEKPDLVFTRLFFEHHLFCHPSHQVASVAASLHCVSLAVAALPMRLSS